MDEFFIVEERDVDYEFIRKDIQINLGQNKELFFENYKNFFIDMTSSKKTKELYYRKIEEDDLNDKQASYLKSTFRRIFKNDDHFKGTIGEVLLCYYFQKIYSDFLDDNPPKTKSSAEPGIDYLVFIGDENDLKSIKFITWETKTTENNASTRGEEIKKFFEKSFLEDLDEQINEIENKYKDKPESNVKKVVRNMLDSYINNESHFNIGACCITSSLAQNRGTLSFFQNCMPDLEKEQRYLNIFFITLLRELMEYIKGEIWDKL